MMLYASSCERPSKNSARVFLPSSVSNSYSFSTGTQGRSRRFLLISSFRSACSASSLASSSRAACHSSRVPILCSGISSPSVGLERSRASRIHRRMGRYRDQEMRPAATRKLIAATAQPQLALTAAQERGNATDFWRTGRGRVTVDPDVCHGSLLLHDRAHLDGATHASRRDARGDLDRGVEVVGLEDEVAAQGLLDGDERPVGRQRLAVLNPHGGCRLGSLQPEARGDAGRLVDRLVVGVDRLLLVLRQAVPLLRPRRRGIALLDQQQVLHRLSSLWLGRLRDERRTRKRTASRGSPAPWSCRGGGSRAHVRRGRGGRSPFSWPHADSRKLETTVLRPLVTTASLRRRPPGTRRGVAATPRSGCRVPSAPCRAAATSRSTHRYRGRRSSTCGRRPLPRGRKRSDRAAPPCGGRCPR